MKGEILYSSFVNVNSLWYFNYKVSAVANINIFPYLRHCFIEAYQTRFIKHRVFTEKIEKFQLQSYRNHHYSRLSISCCYFSLFFTLLQKLTVSIAHFSWHMNCIEKHVLQKECMMYSTTQ